LHPHFPNYQFDNGNQPDYNAVNVRYIQTKRRQQWQFDNPVSPVS
jgi:hypothetical protein